MHRIISLALLCGLLLGSLSACGTQADTIISTQTKVLQQDPNNVTALIERGNAFRDKQEYTSALADHNKAIELSASSGRAYLARGLDYIALSQYENALADLNKAAAFNPELGEIYARRGEARVLLKSEYQAALSDFDKALGLGHDDIRMQRYKGQAHFRLNQRDLAVSAYIKAAEALVNTGELRAQQLAALDEAIDLGIVDARLYLRRGALRRQAGRHDMAIADLDQAIRLNSQNSQAFEERADAYHSIGDCARAQDDLRQACRIENRSLCDRITLSCPSSSASPGTTRDL